jgi:hypothetical protein
MYSFFFFANPLQFLRYSFCHSFQFCPIGIEEDANVIIAQN